MLDAAACGVFANALALLTGKSDERLRARDAATLARSVSDNYAAALANAEQLDALIAVLRTWVELTGDGNDAGPRAQANMMV